MSDSPLQTWSPWLRAIASTAIIYHLGAVLLEPLATPPRFFGEPATLPQAARPWYQPYLTMLSLDHAYKFFAPNPGESHLLRYDLYYADGRKDVGDAKHAFPDPRQHWPRLLYHRYFMLTEFLPDARTFDDWDRPATPPRVAGAGEQVSPLPAPGEAVAPPNAVGEAEPADRRAVQINTYFENIAKRLLAKHGAERVDVWYRVHRLSHPLEVLDDPANPNDGRKINDPDTYRERLQLTYKREGVR